MINVESAKLGQLAIHRVGNKHKGESIFVSQEPVKLTDELSQLLTDYFLKPFAKTTEKFHFVHEVDLSYNPLNGISENIFSDKTSFFSNSVLILRHLFDQSNHPHIKTGDLFIAYFDEMHHLGEKVKAIGIFKSERKDSFLQVEEKNKKLTINTEKGISVKKLDKGCLVLETEEGLKVLSVDNNNYDAEYWKKDFLKIDYVHDENYETDAFLDLCKSFAKDVIGEETKKDEIDFVNHSMRFVEGNQEVSVDDFSDALFSDEETKGDFKDYKKAFEEEFELEMADSFQVSELVLEKQKRTIKNAIQLDTNIQLRFNFDDPDSMSKFVERGYDEEKEMHYYKVYYNEEIK